MWVEGGGRSFVRQWAEFVHRPEVRMRAVFVEDYDMALAEQLVQGVDVWINTPRRPWEASGTSGMKVLVNGGLNLSELDGWWAEAYAPDLGWAIGDGREHFEPVMMQPRQSSCLRCSSAGRA
jgi:starch phosphorylase